MALEHTTRESSIMFLVSTFIFLLTPTYSGFPATLVLEKKTHKNVDLKAQDRARHGHLHGYVNFSVEGHADPYTSGVYYTRVKLGSPPKEFCMHVDTGSNTTLVNCIACKGCQTTNDGLKIQESYYDPQNSTSASSISCFNKICMNKDSCSAKHPGCSYSLQYIDGSAITGHYASDMFYLNTVLGDSLSSNFSAPIVFGCSSKPPGYLTRPDYKAVDGILAFGQNDMSIVSQLSSQLKTPKVFSHCLRGGKEGGGTLALGGIVAPGMVYAWLVPHQRYYNIDLQYIFVGDQFISVGEKELFYRGVAVDSGTALAYFPIEIYEALTDALDSQIKYDGVFHTDQETEHCYRFPNRFSVNDIFDRITLYFNGYSEGHSGAVPMFLEPEEYLMQKTKDNETGLTTWCTAFQQSSDIGGVAVLGDIFLRNKAVNYDLDAQLIGWAKYDCSSHINVSQTSFKSKLPKNGSTRKLTRYAFYRLLAVMTVTIFLPFLMM